MEALAAMDALDYKTLAEQWLDHVAAQYDTAYVFRKDLQLIEYLLKGGFALVAARDRWNVLRVDFLAKKPPTEKPLPENLVTADE